MWTRRCGRADVDATWQIAETGSRIALQLMAPTALASPLDCITVPKMRHRPGSITLPPGGSDVQTAGEGVSRQCFPSIDAAPHGSLTGPERPTLPEGE